MAKQKSSKQEKTIHSKPEPGDYVEVHFGKVVYEGTFLAVPEDEKGIIFLKLDSGYNIGLNKKEVIEINVLEKSHQVKSSLPKINPNKEKQNIALVITGGTIANRYDSKTGAVAPLSSPEELLKFYPEMFEVANVVKIEMPFMKVDSNGI